MGLAHLARRFFGSLRPGGPAAGDDAWARDQLLAGEVTLWLRMSNPDRRHAVGVARDVSRALGPEAGRPVLAAALLHDVGKTVSGLRTPARVLATLASMATGRGRVLSWSGSHGWRRRMGLYVDHPRLGADLLRMAGADPLTITWTREHHLPADDWTIERPFAEALKAADDD